MSKYLKKFELETEYEEYINGSPVIPNVSLCIENSEVYYNPTSPTPPVTPHNLGDIAYWDGSKLAYTPYTSWELSLGTPIGVCFISTSHARVLEGDGKARFLSVKGVTTAGTASDTEVQMKWGSEGEISELTSYTKVPIWDNTIGGTTGSSDNGYISSDRFTGGTQNAVDSGSKYKQSSSLIPSPYAADGGFYEDYRRVIEGNNCLSDFNGKSNTTVLYGLGSDYSAANACYKYSTNGTNEGDWYIPAAGELGYMIVRWNTINEALRACNGVTLATTGYYWSSSMYSSSNAYFTRINNGNISNDNKSNTIYVRPVLMLS